MKKIIVIGHGHFASGIRSAMHLLSGENKDIYYSDFLETDSESDLKEKIEKILKKEKESDVLFFCDLIGGTPYKVAAQIAYANKNYEVIAGCNIGSLLEMLFTKEQKNISQLAKETVSTSRKYTAVFEKNASKSRGSWELEDGI